MKTTKWTMKKASSSLERVFLAPLHFLLFSLYFVLRLYDFNIQEVPFLDLLRPLLLSVGMGLALYLLFGLLVARRWHAAALMTSAWLLAFYLYGMFRTLAYDTNVIRQPEVFAVLWGILFVVLIAWLGAKVPQSPNPSLPAGANLIAIFLLAYPTIGSLVYLLAFQMPMPSQTDHTLQGGPLPVSPDIYYIILDTYPRADVLTELYGYDHGGPFVQSLMDLGFYVAECSQSNYESTPASMTSSLNLDYVQNMSDTFRDGEGDLMNLFKLLDNNNVQETVSNFGYTTVAFASGFPLHEWRDADVFIAPPYGPVTEFETMLMSSTYLRVLDEMEIVNFDDLHAERFRVRTRLILNSFDDLIQIPGPKFVFIHLIIPHAPFVFDALGNPTPPDKVDAMDGYLAQIKFISNAILPNVEKLLEESSSPPVIILQGDHGPWMPTNHAAQLKILNAYYLPNGSEALYPSISPVNSFRVVFNEYFDADLPLLEDKSYYSDLSRRFEFIPMPNTCPQP